MLCFSPLLRGGKHQPSTSEPPKSSGFKIPEGRGSVCCLLAASCSIFTLFASSAVNFPLTWRWCNPSPHGANIVDFAYSSPLTLAVHVAERGQLFSSTDLDLWLPRDTGVTNALQGATFFGQRLIVVGENGLVLYADDLSQFHPGTLVDGPTTDWLVAIDRSPSLLVAAGDNGALYTSTTGISWKRQSAGTNTWFRGIAAGLGNFVVVGQFGTIYTSPNGTNWTKRITPTGQHLNRVQFVNGAFTAVGDAGVTVTSTNSGTNWFLESSGATNALQCVAAGGLDRLLDGSSEVRLHDNGIWSNELANSNGPPAWTYFTALGFPGFFTIAGQSGMISEGYQTTNAPYFWIEPYESVRNWLWDAMRISGFYCAVGDFGSIMTSGNGVDWTLEFVPQTATNTTLLGVGGNTNLLLAAGDNGTILISPNMLTNITVTNGTVITTQTVSSLGVFWYDLPSKPVTNNLQGVAVLSNSLYAITGDKGTILTSTDGSNWTQRASGSTNVLSSVTEWPGGLVAVGDNGTILTSTNGISWSRRTVNTTNWLYRVRWLNGSLVVVGQNGALWTSTDALNWTSRNSGTTWWLNDATFIEDNWFALGVKGTFLTSTNLATWIPRGTITKKALYAAATDSHQLVVVGVEGLIIRSQVIPLDSPVSFLGYSRFATNGSSLAYNVFLFGGVADQRFTLDRRTNLVESPWTIGPELEIFDGAGALYYIETISGTNVPPIEFYRTTLVP
jgi:hypothetical protein